MNDFPNAASPPDDSDPIDARILAIQLEAAQWADQPCRICGKTLTMEDITSDAYFAGFAGARRHAAHGVCWRNMCALVQQMNSEGRLWVLLERKP